MEPLIDGLDTQPATKLPFSFEVGSSSRNSYPFAVTILQKLEAIDIEKLPNSSFTEKQVFYVKEDVSSLISTLQANYLYVKLQTQLTDKDSDMAIMFPVFGRCYGVIKVPKELKSKDLALSSSQKLVPFKDPEEYISSWKLTKLGDSQVERLVAEFSMKPPEIRLHTSDIRQELASPQSQNDPLRFLFSRYYDTLYSLNTPLSYFPKTALTRFKNLCSNDDDKIKEILQKLYIPMPELDKRHDGKYGIIKLIEDSQAVLSVHESERQKEFLQKHGSVLESLLKESKTEKDASKDEKEKKSHLDKFSRMVIELKVREAQLQVLITLELLMLLGIPEARFLEDCQKKQEKELEKQRKQNMRSLVRRKKAKRKIIPTFLGIGLGVSDIPQDVKTNEVTSVDGYTLFKSLNSLSDRMSIWDTLLGKTLSEKDDSSFGFLAYVLVPFCNRKLPLTVKYIIDKFKSLSPKMVNPKRSSSGPKSNGSSRKSSISDNSSDPLVRSSSVDENQLKSVKQRSKYPKLLLGPDNVPLRNKAATLKRSNTSLSDKGDLLPAFSLKRSRSTLSSRNTERRQIDMAAPIKPAEKSSNKNSRQSSITEAKPESKLFIFGDARRVKTMESMPQVQATPAKGPKKDTINVMATPAKQRITVHQTPAKPSGPVIFQTPAKQPSAVVLETPRNNAPFTIPDSSKKVSLSTKLLQESLDSEPDIVSSPAEVHSESVYSSPVQEKIFSVADHTTPPELSSFERRKRKRPGEPVSASESPFFNSTLSGSPFIGKERVVSRKSKRIRKEKEIKEKPTRGKASKSIQAVDEIMKTSLDREIRPRKILQSPEELQKIPAILRSPGELQKIPAILQSPEQLQKVPAILRSPEHLKAADEILLSPNEELPLPKQASPKQNVVTINSDGESDDSDLEKLQNPIFSRPTKMYGRAKSTSRFR